MTDLTPFTKKNMLKIITKPDEKYKTKFQEDNMESNPFG